MTDFGVIHRFNDGFTYGQSFWFTICSTGASLLTNISLIVDYVRTKDFALSSAYSPYLRTDLHLNASIQAAD